MSPWLNACGYIISMCLGLAKTLSKPTSNPKTLNQLLNMWEDNLILTVENLIILWFMRGTHVSFEPEYYNIICYYKTYRSVLIRVNNSSHFIIIVQLHRAPDTLAYIIGIIWPSNSSQAASDPLSGVQKGVKSNGFSISLVGVIC